MTELNCTSTSSIKPLWLGSLDYPSSMTYQDQWLSKIRGTKDVVLLGLEYEKVITAGHRVTDDEIFLVKTSIGSLGYQVYPTKRGGQLTLHGKGQLVVYPLLDLREHNLGVKEYVELCLSTTVNCLQNFGIVADYVTDRTGVYTAKGKISFCGVRIENGVSSHGISLNVLNDLSEFSLITPCGMPGLSMDKIAGYSEPKLEDVFRLWANAFTQTLQRSP